MQSAFQFDFAATLQAARAARNQSSAPNARRHDPQTSKTAAQRVAEFASEHQTRIIAALLIGNGTIHELAARTGIDSTAIARRMKELERANLARPTDQTRASPAGRPCRVWERVARA